MLLRVTGILSGLAALIVFLIGIPAAQPDTTKVIRACDLDSGWPPLSYQDKATGSWKGIAAEVLQEIARRHHQRLEITGLPLARCLDAVQHGQQDLMLSGAIPPEMPEHIKASTPFYTLHLTLFYAPVHFHRSVTGLSWHDLQHLHGCGLIGDDYGPIGLDETAIRDKVHSIQQLLKLVAAGRCDYFVDYLETTRALDTEENDLANGVVQTMPGEKIANIPAGINTERVTFMLSDTAPGYSALAAMIEIELHQIEQDGGLDEIRWRYGTVAGN